MTGRTGVGRARKKRRASKSFELALIIGSRPRISSRPAATRPHRRPDTLQQLTCSCRTIREFACRAGGVHTSVFCGVQQHLAERELLKEPLADRVELHGRGDVLWRRRCRPALQFDAGPACYVPDRQLADQLRLIEAVPLALGREVGQTIQRQPGITPLSSLPLDRLNRAPRCRLRCGHAGSRERSDGDAKPVGQLQLIGLASLAQIDHPYTVPSRSLVSVTVSILPATSFLAPRKSKLAWTPPGPSTASLGLGR